MFYRGLYEKGAPVSYEETLSLPAGKRNWHTTLTPVLGNKNEVIYIVGSSQDITERKEMESKLKESEGLLGKYIDDAPIGIHVVDMEGNYIDANPIGHDLLEYSKDELLG